MLPPPKEHAKEETKDAFSTNATETIVKTTIATTTKMKQQHMHTDKNAKNIQAKHVKNKIHFSLDQKVKKVQKQNAKKKKKKKKMQDHATTNMLNKQ